MPMPSDMEEASGLFTPHHLFEVSGVCTFPEFRIERRDAELWAVRDCKFLIFDDGTDISSGKNVEESSESANGTIHGSHHAEGSPDRGCSRSKEPDNVDDITGDETQVEEDNWKRVESRGEASLQLFWNLGPRYGPSSSAAAPSSNHEDFECKICHNCPEFPHDRKTRNFRLFRPRKEFPELFGSGMPVADNICTHYLAVSYCWPPPVMDDQKNVVETPRTYEVRDLDGNVRVNRALDDVLDRAVDVANSFGLRMIWIDQECLPQPPQDSISPDKEDKALGIQAMDIIYNRAFVTCGLQDVVISSYLQLQTILGLASSSNEQAGIPRITNYRELDIILDFLDKIKNDRWYSRAWVIQEAISAGDNLCLVFRRGPGVVAQTKARMPTRRSGLPKHTLETMWRGLPSEVVCIIVHELRYIVQAARRFIQENSFTTGTNGIFRDGKIRPGESIVAAAETLHPTFWKPKHKNFNFGVVGGTSFGIRPTVDAAGAMTLLKTRGCYHNEDRVAIMANMCGYEHRLNPKVIAEDCHSIRVALLSLALMNNDFSLLVPEAYSGTLAQDPENDPSLRLLHRFRPGWVHPFDLAFQFLEQVSIRGFNLPRAIIRERRPGVVGLPAYLWEVSPEPIDLTPVKIRWLQDWIGLHGLKTEILPQEDEDENAFRERRDTVYQRLETPNGYPYVKQELGINGFVSKESAFWEGIEEYSGTVEFSLMLLSERLETIPQCQSTFAEIFFGILRFLLGLADTDPRAEGVANSIWQSMRVDVVSEEHPELPDQVCEALFLHPAVCQTPFQTISLDKTRDGMYHQTWLIDRIMRHGKLYVGSYVPEPKVDEFMNGESISLPAKKYEGIGFLGMTELAYSVASAVRRGFASPPDGRDSFSASSEMASENDKFPITDEKETSSRNDKEASSHEEGKRSLSDITFNEAVFLMGIMTGSGSIMDRQFNRQYINHIFTAEEIVEYCKLKTDEDKMGRVGGLHLQLTPGSMFSFLETVARCYDADAEIRRSKELFSVFDVDGPCNIAIPYDTAWEMVPHPSFRSMSVCWVVEVGGAPEEAQESITQMIRDNGLIPGLPTQSNHGKALRSLRVLDKVRGFWPIMYSHPVERYTLVDGVVE